MTECWSEGELRAYCDRELPAKDMDRLAAHLENCVPCRERHRQLARQAASVLELVALLPEPEEVAWVQPVRVRAGMRGRWAVAALALAATLALAFVMLPKRTEQQAHLAPPQPPVTAPPPAAEQPAEVSPAVIRRIVPRRRAPQRPLLRADYYLSLDDEPIQNGVVMRVALGAAEVKADVIVGPDGRAHAIRLVGDK
ncbi:MAG: zf-HC2 domain-containing protein [Acidobacteriia bacterium]|nr:zf-HC2 domain-containing protein [Terriglobia bacterium]